MSAASVQAILKRAYIDDTFRLGLAKHFDSTITSIDLDLTAEERGKLSEVDWSTYGTVAGGGGTWVHIYKSAVAM